MIKAHSVYIYMMAEARRIVKKTTTVIQDHNIEKPYIYIYIQFINL